MNERNEPMTRGVLVEAQMTNETQSRNARRRKAKKQSGMTLVEIMIVLVIIGLIAGGVAVALLPQLTKAKEKTTRTDAQSIRSAATMFLAESTTGECPTVDKLSEEGFLDRGKRKLDGWGNEFTVTCEGDNITVISGGADGQVGTEDDIQ